MADPDTLGANRQAKVLVIQPLPGIGDMVWHLPFIQRIAAREGGSVAVLTKRRSAADRLLAADAAIGKVFWVDDALSGRNWLGGVLALSRRLRDERFQRVWILHQSPRYALAAWLAGIPERYGYGFGWQKCWLNRGAFLGRECALLHPIDKACRWLNLMGMAVEDDVPHLAVAFPMQNEVRQFYAAYPRPWFAFGIGSSEPSRQWGMKNFSVLAASLLTTWGGSVFLLGGKTEAGMADMIAQNLKARHSERAVPVIDRKIDEVAALLSISDLFIGNDTGMLNLSAATGTRSIGLFGHAISQRLDDASRNIHAVSPVDGNGDRLEDIRAIEVDMVTAKTLELMGVHADA